MATHQPAHGDRRRAGAFGSAAGDYDRFRPRYPPDLIADLVGLRRMRVLDVGAGTGIAAAQLQLCGADVLAVEPDPRMAQVAAGHGIHVEQATFEDWDPGDRSFDVVVFAQSFHWVAPQPALDKVTSILRPGGRLTLLSNRLIPISPTQAQLDEAYAGYLDKSQRPAIDAAHDDQLLAMVQSYGYAIEHRRVAEDLHYSTEAWVNMVMTYSNVLTLNSRARSELRARLAQCIGAAGVDAQNQATAWTHVSVSAVQGGRCHRPDPKVRRRSGDIGDSSDKKTR
jgi:SAM-dependent methyltransferase